MGNVFRRFAGQKGLRQRPGIRDDTAFPLPPEEAPVSAFPSAGEGPSLPAGQAPAAAWHHSYEFLIKIKDFYQERVSVPRNPPHPRRLRFLGGRPVR